MRHSDIRLTAQVYTDQNLLPLQAAVGGLPALAVMALLLDAGLVAGRESLVSNFMAVSLMLGVAPGPPGG